MLGAGTVINPIIKVVTTVAILAAIYFFIVKPTLDTTNTAFESFTDSFDDFDSLPGIQRRSTTPSTRPATPAGFRTASTGPSTGATSISGDQRCADRFGSSGRAPSSGGVIGRSCAEHTSLPASLPDSVRNPLVLGDTDGMADENVEIVRSFYRAWARNEFPGPIELMHPEIEYVNPAGAVEPGTRRGRDAFAAQFRRSSKAGRPGRWSRSDLPLSETRWPSRSATGRAGEGAASR